MSEIAKLKPEIVWSFFDKICSIPHPSKKEDKIREYIKSVGISLGYETETDEVGNILIRRPADKGYESAPSLLLQSHIDMVCEKNIDTVFDFDNDSLDTYVDNSGEKPVVRAKGTTLGADNGIGVAYMLAILSDDICCGPIECLFTVDEEIGLLGAQGLKKDWIKSKYLINLDSEEQGEFCIGCAGGVNTLAEFKTSRTPVNPNGKFAAKLIVNGLIGGHSGTDIDKNRGNAIKILANTILRMSAVCGDEFGLSYIDGGNLHNAIPREASAVVFFPVEKKHEMVALCNTIAAEYGKDITPKDGLRIELESCEIPTECIDWKSLVTALNECPDGVVSMSESIKWLVQTSTNLASVKMSDDIINVVTSQRSSDNKEKEDIRKKTSDVLSSYGASVVSNDGYPGWNPNPKSRMAKLAEETYNEIFVRRTANIVAIHAGLECGLFLEKYPDLDMISMGPTIRGNHSPAEYVDIESVNDNWKHLLLMIKRIRDNKF